MKEMYKSPVITVEELMKEDVLCLSAQDVVETSKKNAKIRDNIAGTFQLLTELEDIM
jgi:hypothetical protein